MTTDHRRGMAMVRSDELHDLLLASADGDRMAFDALIPRLYPELRRIAHGQLRRLRPGDTWSTTAVVHEAYLKLSGHAGGYADLPHFYAVSARAMRHLLVDLARRKAAAKRGSGEPVEALDETVLASAAAGDAEHVLAIEQALGRLGELDPRYVDVVDCRVFAGFTEEETASALGLSLRSAQRYWQRARAWLAEELRA